MSIKKIILPNKKVRWEVTTRLPGVKVKQVRRRFNKKIDAQKFLDSLVIRKESIKGSVFENSAQDVEGVTLNTEIDYWLEAKSEEFSNGYLRAINPALKWIRDLYGNYKISKLTPAMLMSFRKELSLKGLKSSTQNRYLEILTRIVNFSFKHGRINKNPTVGFSKLTENTSGIDFWNADEIKEFLQFTSLKYPVSSSKRWIFVVYLLALETGLRAREIWGLRVSDVPPEGNVIKVSRQAVSASEVGYTKGRSSRLVPMSETLKMELKPFLSMNLETPLFKSKTGQMIDHDSFKRRVFAKDLTESGVRKIRFHDLRHTALTMMVKNKVSLPVVQKIAGHTKIKTTMRYVHVVASDIEEVGRTLSLF